MQGGRNGRNSMSLFTRENNVTKLVCSYPIFICFQVITYEFFFIHYFQM
jgi:hypothetical protein